MLEVGKIVIAGLTAGGAILLGETIEKGLITIPIFAFEIPFLGSLASILGIFFGALIAGIIGAIALNLIDKAVAKKQKLLNTQQQIEKKNDIIKTQKQLIEVTGERVEKTKSDTISNITQRHAEAAETMKSAVQEIMANSEEINKSLCVNAEIIEDDSEYISENENVFDDLFNELNSLK